MQGKERKGKSALGKPPTEMQMAWKVPSLIINVTPRSAMCSGQEGVYATVDVIIAEHHLRACKRCKQLQSGRGGTRRPSTSALFAPAFPDDVM